jgi:hypothetical protein
MIEMLNGERPVNPDVYLDRPSATRPAPLQPLPGQAATNVALTNSVQAGSKAINLEVEQASGGNITDGQINSALQTYEQAQAKLLAAYEHELSASSAAGEPATATEVFGKQASSPEVQAILALQKADASHGTDGKLKALLGAMPKGANPATVEFIMADPGAQKIFSDYAKEAAGQIANTYNTEGARPAADQLQQIIAADGGGAEGSQLAALIINQSLPTIRSIVAQLPLTKEVMTTGAESRFIPTQVVPDPQGQQGIVSDLAQVVEIAAAGSNPATSTYDTPQIQAAVTGVAQIMATQPNDSLGVNLQAAAGQGYATLGLATGLQISRLSQSELAAGSSQRTLTPAQFASWRKTAASSMLGNVTAGIKAFQSYVNTTVTGVATSAAPLAAQGQYSQVLTNSQFTGGVNALSNGLPASATGPEVTQIAGVKATIQKALQQVVQVGYNLVGVDQAVTFYQGTSLGSLSGYSGVTTARDNLMGGANSMAAELSSPAARDRVTGAILNAALPAKLQHGGIGQQHYSLTAQFVGDFTEFLAENYLTKGAEGAATPASLVQSGANGDQILPAERIGHSAFALAWAGGGVAQLGLTDFVAQNVTLAGPFATERKAVTLLIVGGFGALHTYQAGAALTRWLSTLGNGGKVTSDTLLNTATNLTVEPTLGLIQGLTVLMGLSTIADGAGVFYDATGKQTFFNGASGDTDLAGHSANLLADVILLRLQIRSWAQQSVGKAVLSDSTLSAQFTGDMGDAMLASLGIKTATPVSPAMRAVTDKLLATDPAFRQKAIATLESALSSSGGESSSRLPGPLQSALRSLQTYVGNKGADGTTGFQRAWQRVGSFLQRLSGNSGGDASPDIPAALEAVKGGFADDIAGLTATRAQSAAATWALDSGNAAPGLAKFLANSRFFLNLIEKLPLPGFLKPLLGKAGTPAGEDLPPGLVEALEQNVLPGGAAEGGADVAGEAALDWNPIGWAVNVIYLGTTVANAVVGQVSTRDKFEAYEYTFLRGAGMDAPQAHAMASHSLWTGADASSGLVQAYVDLKGNSNDFIQYVNSMSVGKLNDVLSGLSPLKPSTTPLPQTSGQDYWSLPADPNDAQQRKYSPGLTYNSSAHRWEDKSLGVYYSEGKWVKIGQSPADGAYYDTPTETMVYPNPPPSGAASRFAGPPVFLTPESPQSVDGLRTWFVANNVPLPPTGNS